MNFRYFSWIKEKIGKDAEELSFREEKLVDILRNLSMSGDRYSEIFMRHEKFCVAINDNIIQKADYNSTIVKTTDTISIFPPISGG